MMEWVAEDGFGPYLVSGSRGWLWVPAAPGGRLRSAVVSAVLYPNDVRTIFDEVRARFPGSVFDNLAGARNYLGRNGIENPDLLVSSSKHLAGAGGRVSPGLPEGFAVLLEPDRSRIGVRIQFARSEFFTVALPNVSRSIAFVRVG